MTACLSESSFGTNLFRWLYQTLYYFSVLQTWFWFKKITTYRKTKDYEAYVIETCNLSFSLPPASASSVVWFFRNSFTDCTGQVVTSGWLVFFRCFRKKASKWNQNFVSYGKTWQWKRSFLDWIMNFSLNFGDCLNMGKVIASHNDHLHTKQLGSCSVINSIDWLQYCLHFSMTTKSRWPRLSLCRLFTGRCWCTLLLFLPLSSSGELKRWVEGNSVNYSKMDSCALFG